VCATLPPAQVDPRIGRIQTKEATMAFRHFVFTFITCVCVQAHAKQPPLLSTPPLSGPTEFVIGTYSEHEAALTHMMRPLNASNSILYEQQFGGGGVGAGLLLGPFGVAANVAAIKKRTEAEAQALFDKVALDPVALLAGLLEEAAIARASETSPTTFTMKPTVRIVSDGKESVWIAAGIDVSDSAKPWTGKFVALIAGQWPRSELTNGLSPDRARELEEQVKVAMREALHLYVDDAAGKLQGTDKVIFSAPFLSPRIKFDQYGIVLPSDEAHKVFRSTWAVFSFPAGQAEVTKHLK
jgi:hypothetical protein